MTSKFTGPSAGVRRFLLMSILFALFVALAEEPAYSQPLPGDYNYDGMVSDADYSVLGDTFGQTVALGSGADGNFNGIIDNGDFDVYVAHYGDILAAAVLPVVDVLASERGVDRTTNGQTASFLGVLPFAVTGAPITGGNVEWTFTFSGVNGALAGHLNISTSGPSILSAQGGPLFLDNGINPVGVPGFNQFHAIQQGISFSGNKAFAALGTTLSISPSLFNSNSTLEFLRLVTAGTQPTTLTYAGKFGYGNGGLMISGSATSTVPEPASWALACACMAIFYVGRRNVCAR